MEPTTEQDDRGAIAETIDASQDFLKAFDVTKYEVFAGAAILGVVFILAYKANSLMEVLNKRLEIKKAHEREMEKLRNAHERSVARDKAKQGRNG